MLAIHVQCHWVCGRQHTDLVSARTVPRITLHLYSGCIQDWGKATFWPEESGRGFNAGWSSKLVDHQSWLIINAGWSSKLIDHQSWLIIKAGWSSTLVDHQSWLIIKAISKQLLECTLCQLESKIAQNVGLGKLVALEYVSAVFWLFLCHCGQYNDIHKLLHTNNTIDFLWRNCRPGTLT